jgi:hypothetical protein
MNRGVIVRLFGQITIWVIVICLALTIAAAALFIYIFGAGLIQGIYDLGESSK